MPCHDLPLRILFCSRLRNGVGRKKILGGGRIEGGGSQAGRAQRVIGFTGVSPVQLLALCANGVRLDLEECARAFRLGPCFQPS